MLVGQWKSYRKIWGLDVILPLEGLCETVMGGD